MALNAVGILSPGDMGHVVGRVLVEHGLPVLTCLEGRSERTRTLSHDAGIDAVPSYDELVHHADLILSILVPAEATKVASTVAAAVQNTDQQVVYVECNAIAPATVRSIGGLLNKARCPFVDAGIIGPPPRRPGTTRFYASGPETKILEALRQYGLDVRIVGPEIGQASGLKMAYAALTKGLMALSTELLVAAQRMGLYEVLVDEFRCSQADLYALMEQNLVFMPPKARRWIGEMHQIAATFDGLGLTPKIHEGAAHMYGIVCDTPLADETPETLDHHRTLSQMIEILAKN